MRDDLDKLICESERFGSTRKYQLVRRRKGQGFNWRADLDEDGHYHGPVKQGMRRPHKERWLAKDFGEHLSPLRGLLHKNVGRKWDDVFSELRQRFKPDSATHIHIYSHLMQYVSLYGNWEFRKDSRGVEELWTKSVGINGTVRDFYRHHRDEVWYVDEEGILREFGPVPRYGWVKAREVKAARKKWRNEKVVSQWLRFEYHGGFWYRVTFRPAVKPVLRVFTVNRQVKVEDPNALYGYSWVWADVEKRVWEGDSGVLNGKYYYGNLPEGVPVLVSRLLASKKDLRIHGLRRRRKNVNSDKPKSKDHHLRDGKKK